MLNDLINDCTQRMNKCVTVCRQSFAKLRTGRAHVSLLDHIRVDYYGTEVPLSQCANVTVEDARTLSIQPWDKNMVAVIEKAILTSDLGLNPNTAGAVIRIVLPALTEERRKELVKVVKKMAEEAKVALRAARRDANEMLKELLKEKAVTEDEEKTGHKKVQDATDAAVAKIDDTVAKKEKEILEV